MNTNEKLDAIRKIVVNGFEADVKFDEICASVIGTDGIGFSEIAPLVKHLGIEGGFIVPLADRKINATNDMEARLSEQGFPREFAEAMALAEAVADVCDVPAKWAVAELKRLFKDEGIDFPKKSQMTPWQRAFVAELDRDANSSDKDLERALGNTVKAPEKYVVAYADFARALLAL